MSKTNPDYVLRAQLITQLLISRNASDYCSVDAIRSGGIDHRLLADLGVIAEVIIEVAKR